MLSTGKDLHAVLHDEIARIGLSHGEAAAQLLSPDAIAGECNQCHGSGKRAPRPERATEVRQWLERVRELRAQLDAVRPMIDAVRDTARQQQLRDAYRQADAPLAQSVVDGHYFVFADSNERRTWHGNALPHSINRSSALRLGERINDRDRRRNSRGATVGSRVASLLAARND